MTHREDWPQRSWALAAAGAVIGFLSYLITELPKSGNPALAFAAITFLVVTGMALGFTVERDRIKASAIFAGVAGLIVAFTVYWNGGPDAWGDWEGWRLVTAALTVAIAAPLFQAWGDAGMQRPPRLAHIDYPTVHDRAWMNVVLWFASWLFTGIVWLLAFLIAALFGLIGLDFIEKLLGKAWFGLPLTGAAFGAAVGLLRDREAILITLQTVVRRVLSVLAPVLGAGLVLFLLATIFTGLTPLWEATKATTPILISTVIAAVILSNAAIGDSTDDEAKVQVVRWGAAALAAAMLPLGIIGGISTALRIGQYGLTPDRLWAVVFTGIACAYGLAYLVILIRARGGWMAAIRPANVRLALGLCGLAFLLSMPFINFGSWSTANQVARLESGKVSPDKFDWASLRFDFGPSGEAAVKRLAATGKTPEIRTAATTAIKMTDRWSGAQAQKALNAVDRVDEWLVVSPSKVPVPKELASILAERQNCANEAGSRCMIIYTPGQTTVFGATLACQTCSPEAFKLVLSAKGWVPDYEVRANQQGIASQKQRQDAFKQGKIEVRDAPARRVYVDGQPVGQVFAD